MRKSFNIGRIAVSEKGQALVIPEIGINHNGSLEVAKQMVDSAHRAGARLVKHQTHIVEDEMSGAARKVVPGNSDKSIYEIMDSCALDEAQEKDLKEYVESLGMEFLSTPFSRAAAERLERLGVKAYKIGSGEMNHYPLIDYVASFGKPMIVSTGMNSIESIRKTVEILENRKVDYALLHTTNLYPTDPKLVRLGAMQSMMEEFPEVMVGLSDHTLNNNACIAALGMGASIVERHYTDTMDRVGPDIVCSMDETRLTELLVAAKEIPLMRGGEKRAAMEEQVTIDFAFATLVAISDIKKGEKFTPENLWAKRPGVGGLLAEEYPKVLGKIATKDIVRDTQITSEMIEG